MFIYDCFELSIADLRTEQFTGMYLRSTSVTLKCLHIIAAVQFVSKFSLGRTGEGAIICFLVSGCNLFWHHSRWDDVRTISLTTPYYITCLLCNPTWLDLLLLDHIHFLIMFWDSATQLSLRMMRQPVAQDISYWIIYELTLVATWFLQEK